MKPTKEIKMFKFRRNKVQEVVVCAEDLQVADRFVVNNELVEVLDVTPQSHDEVAVRLSIKSPHGYSVRTSRMNLFNEMLVLVVR